MKPAIAVSLFCACLAAGQADASALLTVPSSPRTVTGNPGGYGAQHLKSMTLNSQPFGGHTTTGGSPQSGQTNVKANGATTVDLPCANSGPIGSAPGWAHPMGYGVQCLAGGNGYTLKVCPPNGNTADCRQTTATPGTAAKVTVAGDPASLTLSSCKPGTPYTHCQLAFTVQGSYSGTSDLLTAQGQQAASSQAGNANSDYSLTNSAGVVDATTGKTVVSGSSPTQTARMGSFMRNQGQQQVSCFGKQNLALKNGKAVYTCDHTQSVKFNGGGTCTPDKQCVQWGNQIQHYTRTCTASRTFTHHTCDVVTTPGITEGQSCTPGQPVPGSSFNNGYVNVVFDCPDSNGTSQVVLSANNSQETSHITLPKSGGISMTDSIIYGNWYFAAGDTEVARQSLSYKPIFSGNPPTHTNLVLTPGSACNAGICTLNAALIGGATATVFGAPATVPGGSLLSHIIIGYIGGEKQWPFFVYLGDDHIQNFTIKVPSRPSVTTLSGHDTVTDGCGAFE